MRRIKTRTGILAVLAIAPAVFAASPAIAQTPGPAAVERVVAPGTGGPRGEGVRVVAPGALVFASLDKDHDGRITDAEISSGASDVFKGADRNADNQLTAFEQGDWANRVGSGADVLANPMLFDTDLDRAVTPAEFRGGLVRLASSLKPPGAQALDFGDLVRPLNARAQAEEDELPTLDGVDRVDVPPGGPQRR